MLKWDGRTEGYYIDHCVSIGVDRLRWLKYIDSTMENIMAYVKYESFVGKTVQLGQQLSNSRGFFTEGSLVTISAFGSSGFTISDDLGNSISGVAFDDFVVLGP